MCPNENYISRTYQNILRNSRKYNDIKPPIDYRRKEDEHYHNKKEGTVKNGKK